VIGSSYKIPLFTQDYFLLGMSYMYKKHSYKKRLMPPCKTEPHWLLPTA